MTKTGTKVFVSAALYWRTLIKLYQRAIRSTRGTVWLVQLIRATRTSQIWALPILLKPPRMVQTKASPNSSISFKSTSNQN